MRRVLAAIGLLAVASAACALPSDDAARVLDGPEVVEIMNPSTTTTTTALTGATRMHRLFFIEPESGLLEAEERHMPLEKTIPDILNELPLGPGTDSQLGNAVPPNLVVTADTTLVDGVLTIDLEEDALSGITGSELSRAVAQLVVTATQLEGWDVERVRFQVDDQVKTIPAGELSEDTRDPVTACDYVRLLVDRNCTNIR